MHRQKPDRGRVTFGFWISVLVYVFSVVILVRVFRGHSFPCGSLLSVVTLNLFSAGITTEPPEKHGKR
jgi:hypothetical protein